MESSSSNRRMTSVVWVLAIVRVLPKRPGRAHPLQRRTVLVGLLRRVGLLLDRVAVLRRRRLDRVEDLRAGRARAVHQDRARPVAGADRDVPRAGRRVQVVPRAHPALLALDDRDAFAGEDKEALEVVLLMVEARRVARPQDVHADPDPVRLVVGRPEAAPRAAARHRPPPDLREVQDVPAVVDRHAADLGVLDLRLVTHGAGGYPALPSVRRRLEPAIGLRALRALDVRGELALEGVPVDVVAAGTRAVVGAA